MTAIENVYMLELNTQLDHRILREIYSRGYSRIPVYEHTRDNIVGILMARDLILINPDKALITLKQMSSIIIRDVIAVDETDKLEPLLGYFKKGLTHIGIVTAINRDTENRDYTKKVIGIVTLEDIIEEIIQEEIEDEYELNDEKNQRKLLKEKLVMLFTDHEAQKVLTEEEIRACLEFLQKYVKPFNANKIKRDILNVLIRKSSVIEIESDERPFSHIIDNFDNGTTQKYAQFNQQQAMYNSMKNASNKENKTPNTINQIEKSKKIGDLAKNEKNESYAPEILKSTKSGQKPVTVDDI